MKAHVLLAFSLLCLAAAPATQPSHPYDGDAGQQLLAAEDRLKDLMQGVITKDPRIAAMHKGFDLVVAQLGPLRGKLESGDEMSEDERKEYFSLIHELHTLEEQIAQRTTAIALANPDVVRTCNEIRRLRVAIGSAVTDEDLPIRDPTTRPTTKASQRLCRKALAESGEPQNVLLVR